MQPENHWLWSIQRRDGELCFTIATIDSTHWVSEVSVRQVCPSNMKESATTQIHTLVRFSVWTTIGFETPKTQSLKAMLKSGLTVDRQIFSRLKQQVTKLVQQAKTEYYSAKICTSATCRDLFLNVNILLRKSKTIDLSNHIHRRRTPWCLFGFLPEQDHHYSQQPWPQCFIVLINWARRI